MIHRNLLKPEIPGISHYSLLFLSKLIFLLLLFPANASAQFMNSSETFRIMFYNVENFFDIWDDSVSIDEEFTPEGEKHWTIKRYNNKLNHLFKTIVALGEWETPGIIGLCEVENKKILNDLVYKTPLSKMEYAFIHYNSSDPRGIDVAMLYMESKFQLVYSEAISLKLYSNTTYHTRDILYVKGILMKSKDTIHLFINHWPSRRSGVIESEPWRIIAAGTLKRKVDSLLLISPFSKIIIMGDFNDQPDNTSLKDVLMAGKINDSIKAEKLCNLAFNWKGGTGSYKYQGVWYMFDQFIISGNLLNVDSSVCADWKTFDVFSNDFLLSDDEIYLGIKPYPTYYGYKYLGGFSDHLPIKIDLIFNNKKRKSRDINRNSISPGLHEAPVPPPF